MDVNFARVWVLSLLWVVPAAAVWWTMLNRRRRAALASFVSPALQAKILPADSGHAAQWQIGLVCAGVALMLVAAARPQWGQREEIVYTRGRDLLIALDVSRSMLANDVHPNRLRRAKADIMDLIGELRGDRAGLLAFRHKAVLLCPLTTDYAYLRQSLDAVDPGSAPRGETDIGDAIEKALDAFDIETGSHRAIVLISDGEDLSGRALEAAAKAAEKGVAIFTVGIGDQDGARIPDPDTTGQFVRYKDEDVVTRLDNKTLYEIARLTGGAYVPIGTSGMAGTTLGTIYKSHLRRVAEQDLEETLQRRYVERYQPFLLSGICLVMIACFLSRGRLRTGHPDVKPPPAVAGLRNLSAPPKPLRNLGLLLVATLVYLAPACRAEETPAVAAQTNDTTKVKEIPVGRSGARLAQRLYRSGDYKGAADAYLQAAAGATRDSRETFRFNAAAAHFKAGEYEKAARILSDLDNLSTRPDPTVGAALGSSLARAAAADDPQNAGDLEKKLQALTDAAEAYAGAARAGAGEDVLTDLGSLLHQLPELREESKIAKLEEKYANQQPFQIADQMLKSQRDIRGRIAAAQGKDVPDRIRAMEELAKEQGENADLWIPLKGKLMSALSQQAAQDKDMAQQMGQLAQGIELTRDSMKGTANVLRDARFDGDAAVSTDENAVYGFWKMLAPAGPLVSEAMQRQTNAIGATESGLLDEAARAERVKQAAEDQMEVRGLTDLFVERFQLEHPEEASQQVAPAATNAAPALSPEDRQKILEAAAQAQQKEQEAYDLLSAGDLGRSLAEQETVHQLLGQIAKLLPVPPPQEGEQQQQEQQQDQQKQEQQQDQQEQQDQQKQEQQKQDGSEKDQQQSPPEQSEAQSQESDMTETNDVPPEEVMELLEKALQREREHEAEKRDRNQRFPMAPHEKDW